MEYEGEEEMSEREDERVRDGGGRVKGTEKDREGEGERGRGATTRSYYFFRFRGARKPPSRLTCRDVAKCIYGNIR